MKKYLLNLALAFDQMCNTILGGFPDETFSSRCYRRRDTNHAWRIVYTIVNCIFFWQKNHCKSSWESEMLRRHFHISMQ